MSRSKQPKEREREETSDGVEYESAADIKPASALQLPDSTTVMDLAHLATHYSHCVPFRFQVVNGFMAENVKDPTLSVDEIYSVHLVREIKVIVLVKVGSKSEFKVPVNSALRFGLVHEKTTSLYESVEGLMNAATLPKVVCVLHKYVDEKFALHKNEILLVKDIMKPKLGRGKSLLRVFSMSTFKEILLPKDCHTQFSTDPKYTALYLTDLLKYANEFMPCLARVSAAEGCPPSLIESLLHSIVRLDRKETHRSVVVSLFRDNPDSKKKKEVSFIDIPISINIRVHIVKTDKSDKIYQRIYEESQNLIVNYNPSKIQACVDAETDADYVTQAQLLAEIRKERAKKEMVASAPPQYQSLLLSTSPEKGGSNTQLYQGLSLSGRGSDSVFSGGSHSSKSRVKREGSNPSPQQYQKLVGGERDFPRNYKTVEPAVSPRPPVDKPKPGRRQETPRQPSFDPSHTSPRSSSQRTVPRPPPSIPPREHRGSSKEQQQSHKPTELDNVSLTAEEKFSMWQETLAAAENPDPGPSPSPSPDKTRKPPRPVPAPRSYSTTHDYEEMESFQGTPLPSDSWSGSLTLSDGKEKQAVMPPVPEVSRKKVRQEEHSSKRAPELLRDQRTGLQSIASDSNAYVKMVKTPDLSLADGEVPEHRLLDIEKKLLKISSQMEQIIMRQNLLEEEMFDLKRTHSSQLLMRGSQDFNLPTISAGMSPADVQATLNIAGLSQYKENFAREAVDGDMFMVLDEEILSLELGVTSKLHRFRLLKMKGK